MIGNNDASTRERLARLFEDNKGVYLSGERIAGELRISRTAVWKAVNSLKSAGYELTAIRNKGYCLSENTDILSGQGVIRYLGDLNDQLHIEVFPEISSTNTYLSQKALEGAAEGLVAIAGRQSAGRGRRGRTFESPADSGVYMSILLRPEGMLPEDAVRITTMAAVSVCEAIEEVSERQAQIKWVNDVFIDGRKVCGILTEAAFGPETGCLEHIIVGIGINVYQPEGGFDSSIKDIAGAVFTEKQNDGRNHIAAAVLNAFMHYYMPDEQTQKQYVSEYRRRSLVIGKPVSVLKPEGPINAMALDIDGDCHLLVRYADGSTESLSSGEISIRM